MLEALLSRQREYRLAAVNANAAAGAMYVAQKVLEEALTAAVAEDLAAGKITQAEADAARKYLGKAGTLLAEMSAIYRAQHEKSRHEAGALQTVVQDLKGAPCGSPPDRPTGSPTPS